MESPLTSKRRRRGLRAWHVVVGVVFLVALVIGTAVALPNWNFVRGPIAQYLSVALKRTVSIDGDFKIRFSLQPTIELNGLTIANASWSARPAMAQIGQLRLRVDVPPLLRGRIVLREVRVAQASIVLETNAEGKHSWEFNEARSATGTGEGPEIGTLVIQQAQLEYDDPRAAMRVALAIDSDTESEGGSSIRFAGRGSLRKDEFQVEGRADSLLALMHQGKPYRLDVRAIAGPTRVSFAGTLVPFKLDTIDGRLQLSGKDLSKLYPIVPVPLPWSPPYSLSGHLVHNGETWKLVDFKGRMGASDLEGDFSLNRHNKRSTIVADITSRRLNYKDLAGFLGMPPPHTTARARAPDQEREAAKRATTERALPDKPYDLTRLRAVDADVRFRGRNVLARDIPLDKVVAHLTLKNGKLRFEPLDFGVAGGDVVSEITLDARQELIESTADITVKNVDVATLVPALKANKASAGRMGGRAKVEFTGNSIAQMGATADGEFAVIMAKGRVSTLSLLLTNLDLANAATMLLGGDQNAPVYCAVVSGKVSDGLFIPQLLIADTSEEKITGEGKIDVRDERWNLRLKADSKRPSIVALRGPIRLEGTFKHPKIVPEAGPVVARVAAAVALGVLLTPPAALLALIDPGGARDSNCPALIAQAEAVADAPHGPAAPGEAPAKDTN
jgi:uncharacterized protein involved in outer membrane biogenesis